MGKQLFLGLAAEGNTDIRFLDSVVRRTFEQIVFEECEQEVDIDLFVLKFSKSGNTFPEFVAEAARIGLERFGVLTVVVHTDSDKETLEERLKDKFEPANKYLLTLPDEKYCKIITPVIPIRMIEAWVMADTNLLKEEIGTALSDAELGLDRAPESVANPKEVINKAIIIAQQKQPRKRRNLILNDLYDIIGGKISLSVLDHLSSYIAFKEAVRHTLRMLHYLPE